MITALRYGDEKNELSTLPIISKIPGAEAPGEFVSLFKSGRNLVKASEMEKLLFVGVAMKKDLFKNCKVQYTYDNKVYGILVYLEKEQRILNFRIGDKYAEISLADRKGNVLEVLSQENGEMKFIKQR